MGSMISDKGGCGEGRDILSGSRMGKMCRPCTSGAGNLFRARAKSDFPEQLVGRSNKRKPQNNDVPTTIIVLQSRQISETAGASCHEEVFRWMSSTTAKWH